MAFKTHYRLTGKGRVYYKKTFDTTRGRLLLRGHTPAGVILKEVYRLGSLSSPDLVRAVQLKLTGNKKQKELEAIRAIRLLVNQGYLKKEEVFY